MRNKKYLEGKNALITGGGRGIGKAIAMEFAKSGANVAVVALERDEVEKTATELNKVGVRSLGIPADLSNFDYIKSIKNDFFKNFDKCDILVNNAGMSHYSTVLDFPLEKAIMLFNVNLISYYVLIKEFLPSMIENEKGNIIMTSSVQGNMFFNPKKVAYSTTKAAVTAMGKTLAAELKDNNVQVNVILPGAIDTKLVKDNADKGQITPDPKPPGKISPIYLFLASDLSHDKYDGRIINEYLISQILKKIKEETIYKTSNFKSIMKNMEKKLTKGQYKVLRKNRELIEFLISPSK